MIQLQPPWFSSFLLKLYYHFYAKHTKISEGFASMHQVRFYFKYDFICIFRAKFYRSLISFALKKRLQVLILACGQEFKAEFHFFFHVVANCIVLEPFQ